MRLKVIERAWQRFWIGVLTRAAARKRARAAREPPIAPGQEADSLRRVLFLRPDRIGDMIVSTGLLRAIATARDGITLDVLASPANAPIARAEPWVHRVHVFDRRRPWRTVRLIAALRAARYDAVIDCMPTAASLTTMLLMLATGARERIGVAGRANDAALTIAVGPRAGARHIIDHLSALAAAFGVDPAATDFAPALTLDPAERVWAMRQWRSRAGERTPARRLLVNVSAGKPRRRWPDASFVAVLGLVGASFPDVQPLVVGDPREAERVAAIARAGGAPVAHTRTLREALALIATADVVLSADTGLAHAAAAFRRPAVVLHLRGSATLWGLYGAPGCVLESTDRTLASLPVAPVWRALEALLRPGAADRPAADAPEVLAADGPPRRAVSREVPQHTEAERPL